MLLIAAFPTLPCPSEGPMPDPVIDRALPPPQPRAVELVGMLKFRKAREKDRWGHPQVPHEYTVRVLDDPELNAAYVELFRLIQSQGVPERWKRMRPKQYLYPGDGYKYWAMTTDEEESRILNRMRPEEDEHSRPVIL